jgi:hypothetical protein
MPKQGADCYLYVKSCLGCEFASFFIYTVSVSVNEINVLKSLIASPFSLYASIRSVY